MRRRSPRGRETRNPARRFPPWREHEGPRRGRGRTRTRDRESTRAEQGRSLRGNGEPEPRDPPPLEGAPHPQRPGPRRLLGLGPTITLPRLAQRLRLRVRDEADRAHGREGREGLGRSCSLEGRGGGVCEGDLGPEYWR